MTETAAVPGRRAKSFACYGAFIGLGLVLASLGPTIPDLAPRTGSTLSAFSAIFIAHSGGYLAGALLGGRPFDRLSGHPLTALMLANIAVCMVAVPLSPSLGWLIAIFAAMGVSEGTLDAGGPAAAAGRVAVEPAPPIDHPAGGVSSAAGGR